LLRRSIFVARVMREGAVKHPDNDWLRRPHDYHLSRAEEHLRLLREGDQRQEHLSHAATRLPGLKPAKADEPSASRHVPAAFAAKPPVSIGSRACI